MRVVRMIKQLLLLSCALLLAAPCHGSSRMLQDDILPADVPPTRQCGQVINRSTVAQIKRAAEVFVLFTWPADHPQFADAFAAFQEMVKYDLEAHVVCGSCVELQAMGVSGDKFDGYCGEDRFGSDVTHSALMLLPVDPATGEVVEGTLKVGVDDLGAALIRRSYALTF